MSPGNFNNTNGYEPGPVNQKQEVFSTSDLQLDIETTAPSKAKKCINNVATVVTAAIGVDMLVVVSQ